jgi:hypothetical protein
MLGAEDWIWPLTDVYRRIGGFLHQLIVGGK